MASVDSKSKQSIKIPLLVTMGIITAFIAAIVLIAIIKNNYVPNSKIRFSVLYFDLHSTLLDPDLRIHEANLEAIKKFMRCGGGVGVATGGSYDQVRLYLEEISPNLPIVLFNGAVIEESGIAKKVAQYLPIQTVEEIARYAQSQNKVRGVILQNTDLTIIDRDDAELLKSHFIRDLDGKYVIDEGLKQITEYNVLKMTIWVQENEGWFVHAKLKDRIREYPEVEMIVSSPWSIEVVAKGVNKGKAVQEIFKQRGISVGNVIAFGDSDNDVSLFQEAGVAVAMGNCSPSACEAATVIIGKNDTDAIANFLNRVVMTPQCE